jgi:general secretion pathway protein J
MNRPTRARDSGFTLLETIVTLVVVSLIVTVLMQMLHQALGLRSRLLRHERASRVSGLQEQWFRDTVSSAVADLPDAYGAMSGTADSLELVTPAPLEGTGLQHVRWRLEGSPGAYALTYAGDGAAPVQVVAGPLHDAAFSYLDGQGQWQPQWKPDQASPEVLPRMVRLQAGTAGGELVWIVPVLSDPWRPVNLRPEESFGL